MSDPPPAAPLVALDAVCLTLPSPAGPVDILRGISLDIAAGETVGLVGPSGSGKTSLLMVMAGLERPSSGSVHLAGNDLAALSEDALARLRRTAIGIVFQGFHLIPTMTALENVAIPLELAGRRDAFAAAGEALSAVGLRHRWRHYPAQLSGGEQQRVAIARAFVAEPRLLLADEPTGELDSATAMDVFAALQTANSELGATVLVVTHDPAVSSQVRRTIAIADGRTSTETLRQSSAEHAVEYAVLDRAGRLQLPLRMIEPLGMRDRVRLEAEPDHIGVWPDQPAGGEPE